MSEPPVPDMINWENRYKNTFIRSFISWLLVIVLCLACYLLFGYLQYRQTELNSNYSYKIDCKVLFPSVTSFAAYDPVLFASGGNNYLTCYCQGQSLTNIIGSQESYCSTWQKEYITYQAIPLLLSLIIVIVNVIVGQIFRILSIFERQKNAEKEQLSYAFKRAFLLMMNMALVMILLNINYANTINWSSINFIFQGKFSDFTSDWY